MYGHVMYFMAFLYFVFDVNTMVSFLNYLSVCFLHPCQPGISNSGTKLSDKHQMGKIWDLLDLDVLNSGLKKLGFVPFGANLIFFVPELRSLLLILLTCICRNVDLFSVISPGSLVGV